MEEGLEGGQEEAWEKEREEGREEAWAEVVMVRVVVTDSAGAWAEAELEVGFVAATGDRGAERAVGGAATAAAGLEAR
jgi:hypothetical protein